MGEREREMFIFLFVLLFFQMMDGLYLAKRNYGILSHFVLFFRPRQLLFTRIFLKEDVLYYGVAIWVLKSFKALQRIPLRL